MRLYELTSFNAWGATYYHSVEAGLWTNDDGQNLRICHNPHDGLFYLEHYDVASGEYIKIEQETCDNLPDAEKFYFQMLEHCYDRRDPKAQPENFPADQWYCFTLTEKIKGFDIFVEYRKINNCTCSFTFRAENPMRSMLYGQLYFLNDTKRNFVESTAERLAKQALDHQHFGWWEITPKMYYDQLNLF